MKKYFEARRLKNNLDAVIQAYNVFTQKPGNMYGIKIGQEKVKDTLLVSAKIITTKYPSEEEVYNLINKVKKYIQDNGGKETNYPMLHVEAVPAGNVFETMVAIPTDKPLEGNDDIKPKRMVAGKILVAEIKGGISNIEDGFRLMETYMDDHKKVSPAIPFQSLVTDRLKEPDTTKWLTKIYYPIF